MYKELLLRTVTLLVHPNPYIWFGPFIRFDLLCLPYKESAFYPTSLEFM